jgi:hypothetical protein
MKGQYVEWEKMIFDLLNEVVQTKDRGFLLSGTTTSEDGDFKTNPNKGTNNAG